MATILGLRDVKDFAADERPKNWRDTILMYYPRSEQKAPLNALIAGMKTEATDDPEFAWFDKASPIRFTQINYSTGYTTGATSFVVDSSAPFRNYDLVKNARTAEVMKVSADPADSTHITVARAWGSAAAAINDDDYLFIVGTAIAEGARARSGLYNDPTKRYNFTQIFRYPLKLTNTAKATHLRTGKAWANMKQEAMDQHLIDMERAYIFGVRNEDLNGTEPIRSTGGIISFLSTNVTNIADGHMTRDVWNGWMKQLFQFGTGEKLCFCGNTFLMVFQQLCQFMGTYQITQGASVFGIKLTKYECPFGTVYFKNHPLFNEIPDHSKMGLFIEPKHIIYRPLVGNGVNRDTQYLKNREDADEDCTKDEFLTEAGLEVQLEKVHGVLTNVADLSATP